MKLALFDLDHTLLPIDSADTWSRYIVRAGGLDVAHYEGLIAHYAAGYRAGSFDVEAYLAFQMRLLAQFKRAQLEQWRTEFMQQHVLPQIRPEALALIARHRDEGCELVLITGTNAFVTAPIAAALGLPHLLAVQPEQQAGEFTGRYTGTHTYQAGKVRAATDWLQQRGLQWETLETSWFYSDSINDLPLLEQVQRPIATNPDPALRALAVERGWPVFNLFQTTRPAATGTMRPR